MKIGKISATSFGLSGLEHIRENEKKQNNASQNQELMGAKESEALKASALYDIDKLKDNIAKAKEIRVPDLFNIEGDIHLSFDDMDKDYKELNAAGLNVVKSEDEKAKYIEIKNDEGDTIFRGEVEKGKEVPTVVYKQGKYMPEITVKDKSLSNSVVKMFSGSKIEGDGFSFVMPGKCEDLKDGKTISFTGKTVITTLNKEPRTRNAVDLYMNSNLPQETIPGDYSDFAKENDPTVVIPAGGFGERFKNMTREKENKPSYLLPTSDKYRIIATALNMASSMGIIDKDAKKNSLTYVSQNGDIEGDNVKHVQKYKTDGGAVAEALDEDYVDRNKDVIVLNGDIISNADMSRVYKAFKDLPNAALVIPHYSVDPERAKAFGLLGFEEDEDGKKILKSFIEKTPYTNIIPKSSDFASDEEYNKAMDSYIAARKALNPDKSGELFINPGIYVMSPEATKVLRHMGIKNPEKTGLGKHVMPEIVRLCNEGKLLNEKGEPMKAYIVPLETKGGKPAFWDDIGTAEAYLSTIKRIAKETQEKGVGSSNEFYGIPSFALNDFVKNTDLETGVVYMSEKSRNNVDKFKNEHNVSKFEGNIFVV